jgi:hypothetical protein
LRVEIGGAGGRGTPNIFSLQLLWIEPKHNPGRVVDERLRVCNPQNQGAALMDAILELEPARLKALAEEIRAALPA